MLLGHEKAMSNLPGSTLSQTPFLHVALKQILLDINVLFYTCIGSCSAAKTHTRFLCNAFTEENNK